MPSRNSSSGRLARRLKADGWRWPFGGPTWRSCTCASELLWARRGGFPSSGCLHFFLGWGVGWGGGGRRFGIEGFSFVSFVLWVVRFLGLPKLPVMPPFFFLFLGRGCQNQPNRRKAALFLWPLEVGGVVDEDHSSIRANTAQGVQLHEKM